jgi:hypothetical protein
VKRSWFITGVVLLASLTGVAPAGATAPGSLPQTRVEPSFAAPLTRQMQTLVRAIALDSPALGATVFFPRAAYLQMKTGTIPDPSSDYAQRLVAFFDLDLAAYHERLFTGPRSTLLRVSTNPALAAWISPGACENRIGYWYAPRVRLVMHRAGTVVSVAVASLISWRGVWYVVHLGPNPRPLNVGTVDDFRRGPGTPGPGGGC